MIILLIMLILWIVSFCLTIMIVGKVTGTVTATDLGASLVCGPIGTICWLAVAGNDICLWRKK